MSGQGDSPDTTAAVVAAAFGVAILAAVGAGLAYALGEEVLHGAFTQWLGACLGVALAAIGAGLVVWAHGLMPQGPEVEEREFPAPEPAERAEAVATFEEQKQRVGRRSLLGRLLAAAAGATGLAALFPVASFSDDPFPERALTGWREGVRVVTEDGEPVRVTDLAVDSALTVFPEGRITEADSQVMLIRLRPGLLDPPPGREDWSPEGYVAFSKICTHAGCPVGLYQTETQRLLCPCHQSAFDVLEGARPHFGPATRPLPQLPLEVDDEGFLVARSDFDRPVGPGFWTWPSWVQDDGR